MLLWKFCALFWVFLWEEDFKYKVLVEWVKVFIYLFFNDSPIYRTLFSYLTKGFENIPQKKISKMKKFGRYRKDSRSILWQKIFHFLLLIFLITFQISMNNLKKWMVNGCMHRTNLIIMSKSSITICTTTRPCDELWLVKECLYMNS